MFPATTRPAFFLLGLSSSLLFWLFIAPGAKARRDELAQIALKERAPPFRHVPERHADLLEPLRVCRVEPHPLAVRALHEREVVRERREPTRGVGEGPPRPHGHA